jgi:type I site-specific restriction endonuclease
VGEEDHDYLAAEARARKEIDRKLVEAGWVVQDRSKANLYAGQGVALREFVHEKGHGCSDYALYVCRQLVGVLEAKPDDSTLTEVERQAKRYIDGVAIPAPVTPLPFGYEATGSSRALPASRTLSQAVGGYSAAASTGPRPCLNGWAGSPARQSCPPFVPASRLCRR